MKSKKHLRTLGTILMSGGAVAVAASLGITAYEQHVGNTAAATIAGQKKALEAEYAAAKETYRKSVHAELQEAAKTAENVACAPSVERLGQVVWSYVPDREFFQQAKMTFVNCGGGSDLGRRLGAHAQSLQEKRFDIDDRWRKITGEDRRVPRATLDIFPR